MKAELGKCYKLDRSNMKSNRHASIGPTWCLAAALYNYADDVCHGHS